MMNLSQEQEEMKKRWKKPDKPIRIKVVKEKRKWQTYFIQGRMSGLIKIGKSLDPKKRVAALQIGSAEDLVLVAVIPRNQEKQLHKAFAKDKARGEWFYPESILKYLKQKYHQFI